MTIEKNCVLHSDDKKSIVYDLYYTSTPRKKPVVIFCHGYKGFKDWGPWQLVAETFAKAGFIFLKFNFSLNGGTVTNPIDFPDLESFAMNNYSTELDDLDRVLNFVISENSYESEMDLTNINVIGHSRGGGIALIKAEEDLKIKSVTTWAAVSDFKARFQEGTDAFKAWKTNGITYIENGRTKQQMPLYFQFYTDFIENEVQLTIKRAVMNLRKPQLIIHGREDATVSIKEAMALHSWNPKSQFEVVQEANHTFGTIHPWEEDKLPKDLLKAVNLTIKFLIKNN